MRKYSDKQLNLANRLCNEFGFEDPKFINDFLEYYAANFGSYQKNKDISIYCPEKSRSSSGRKIYHS